MVVGCCYYSSRFRPWKTTRKVKKIGLRREGEKSGKKSRVFWKFCSFSFPTVWEKSELYIRGKTQDTHKHELETSKIKYARRATHTKSGRRLSNDWRRWEVGKCYERKRRGGATLAPPPLRAPGLFSSIIVAVISQQCNWCVWTDWSSSTVAIDTYPDAVATTFVVSKEEEGSWTINH